MRCLDSPNGGVETQKEGFETPKGGLRLEGVFSPQKGVI